MLQQNYRNINSYKLIVTKSTVVGTTHLVKDLISGNTDQEFDVASNPEFSKEGSAQMISYWWVVVGVESAKAEKIKELYEPFIRKEFRLVVVILNLPNYQSIRLTCLQLGFLL